MERREAVETAHTPPASSLRPSIRNSVSVRLSDKTGNHNPLCPFSDHMTQEEGAEALVTEHSGLRAWSFPRRHKHPSQCRTSSAPDEVEKIISLRLFQKSQSSAEVVWGPFSRHRCPQPQVWMSSIKSVLKQIDSHISKLTDWKRS